MSAAVPGDAECCCGWTCELSIEFLSTQCTQDRAVVRSPMSGAFRNELCQTLSDSLQFLDSELDVLKLRLRRALYLRDVTLCREPQERFDLAERKAKRLCAAN